MNNLAVISEIKIPFGHGYDFEVNMSTDVPYVIEERDVKDIQVFYAGEYQGRFANIQMALAFVDYCHEGGYSPGDIDAFTKIHKLSKRQFKGTVYVEED